MNAVVRLLELARRELHASDSYIQIGGLAGTDSDDPCRLEVELRPDCRWVVRFDEPPTDGALLRRRMAELAEAFDETVGDALGSVESLGAAAPPQHDSDALAQVLASLRDATGAETTLVIDRQSPMVWGLSDPDLGLTNREHAIEVAEILARPEFPSALTFARTEPPNTPELGAVARARRALRVAEDAQPGGSTRLATVGRALAVLADKSAPLTQQPEPPTPGIATKEIVGLYWVVLVFADPFSPLRIEGILRRALPVIERHIVELPPLDPTPKGNRVVVPLRRD